jgi:hypothetical protein
MSLVNAIKSKNNKTLINYEVTPHQPGWFDFADIYKSKLKVEG